MKNYDVAIIGAGPAGLFAAHSILEKTTDVSIALIDKGKAPQDRNCCENCCICEDRDRCSILCGIGGGGLFSDGKLVLDLHSGGKLDAIANLSEENRLRLTNKIVETLKRHDGKSEYSPSISNSQEKYWKDLCHAEGLEIKHYDVLHLGTENLHHITTSFANDICKASQIDLKLNCEITQLSDGPNETTILYPNIGEPFSASNIIFSVGKTGSEWLKSIFEEKQIALKNEPTYVGIRLEVPQDSIENLLKYSFDPKIWTYYGSTKVKTHCFCRHGDIVCTNYMGFPVVGGHTRFTNKNQIPLTRQSSNGNFNILVSTMHSKNDIYDLLKQFQKANSKGLLKQNLLDFLHMNEIKQINNLREISERIKDGDIRKILDSFDLIGSTISDFIIRLSKIVPGIISKNSTVYAPAIEWFMDSVEVDSNMETLHKGWFAVGDGAGLSQGIVHSAATSIIAAEEICKRIKA